VQVCPSCKEENPDKFRVCGFCGTALAAAPPEPQGLICPSCGEENPAKFRVCGFCGTALAPALGAQEVRKTVSIVFSDLKGSTAMGEKLDSEAVREVMSRYFDEMRAALEAHGGTIEKYIGDAIMAVFGLPKLHEDDALRAVRAAAEMRDRLAALNAELDERWGVTVGNRTGVNTGEVVAGDPTTGQRLVTGDTVNTAARLEQAAPTNEVLLGEETYRLVRHAVEVEPVEPLELKGKADRVPAYRLVRVVDADDEIVRRRDAPLVGRETESMLLREAFDLSCRDRRCGAVTLIGPAGLGKSRLTEELSRYAREQGRVLRGRCLPYGDGITFWPLVEVLRQAADLDHSDDAEAARLKLAGLVGDRDDVLRRLTSVLGLSAEQFPVQEVFWATRKLFELLAAERPLVVVFEDLHWAEGTFLDLIEHLVREVEAAPVFLLANARPELLEERPAWPETVNSTTVVLKPLGAEASEHVIANMLGGAELEATVRVRIVEAAEGNPLFVEQLLSMLLEDGLIVLDEGRWRATGELPDVTLPRTIQALLASRVDRLTLEERAVIEPASVVGYVFPEDAVRELAAEPVQPQVPALLKALGTKQLVRPEPAERSLEAPWRFDHVLIRDTVYEALLKRARATLHERFVRWADRVNGDRAVEYEEILGYHLEQAFRYLGELGPIDDRGREIGADGARRLAAAGRRARLRGDVPAAVNLLERASRLVPEHDPLRLGLLPELGEAQLDLGRFEDTRATLDDASAAADALSDRRLAADARLTRLLLELRSGALDNWVEQAVPEIEQAIAILTDAGDEAALAKAWRLLGYVHGTGCRYAEAERACEQALIHARRAGDSRESRVNATSYALAACWGPTPATVAIERCNEVLEQVSASRLSRGWVLSILGHLHAMQGDFERARALCRDGRAEIEELGSTWYAAWTALPTARVEFLAGEPAAAERELRRGDELLAQMGERYLRSTVTALLARSVLDQGRLNEAYELTEAAEELSGADDVETQAAWRSVRAASLARAAKVDEALRLAQDALQLLLDTDSAVMQIEALAELAEVLTLAGDSGAEWALAEARRLAEVKGNVPAANALEELAGRLGELPARAL
jgi:class 3 adenylate cyclase/tetratricopeptide (TPR) repeat protein